MALGTESTAPRDDEVRAQRIRRFNSVAMAAWITYAPIYALIGATRIAILSVTATAAYAVVQWSMLRKGPERAQPLALSGHVQRAAGILPQGCELRVR